MDDVALHLTAEGSKRPVGMRDEEEWGTSRRLSVAPVSLATLLGGKLLARFLIGVTQLLILLLFGHFAYGLTLGESPFAMLMVVVCIVFSMACFRMNMPS